ncbi:MAG: Cof-type HAD-IIB family hydrolase [Synergistaceae bacterium]|jgi:Cof subfamily protein (haloacid dehalogenase superfamily)|nr:Cof-type HAD-IIB family hydrolase [Synergistaceae bacterium]
MKQIKLIVTDLDGTLLDSSGQVTEASRRAISRAVERGVTVTIITGRMFASARQFVETLGIKSPFGCFNGAMIRDANGGLIAHMPLDLGAARGVLSFFKDRGIYVQTYIGDLLCVKDPGDKRAMAYSAIANVPSTSVGDEVYDPPSAPTKLLVVTNGIEETAGIMRELSETFGNSLYITSSNPIYVEVLNPEANKGRGLEILAKNIGVGMESIMAIGDGNNDVEMVSLAGVGIAMGNGLEKIRSAADDVAPTNDEDGFAWAVEKYVLCP